MEQTVNERAEREPRPVYPKTYRQTWRVRVVRKGQRDSDTKEMSAKHHWPRGRIWRWESRRDSGDDS